MEIEFSELRISDREQREILTIVRIGQVALRRRLEAAGLSSEETRRISVRERGDVAVGDADFMALIASANASIASAQDDLDFREILDEAVAELGENPTADLLTGEGKGGYIRALTFASIAIMATAKLYVNVDLGSVKFGLDHGVPAGVADIVNSVGGVLADEISGRTGASKPSSAATHAKEAELPKTAAPPGNIAVPTHEASSGARERTTSAALSVPAVRHELTLPLKSHRLDRHVAFELKKDIVRFFEQNEILAWCGITDHSQVFGPSQGFGKGEAWPYGRRIVVGAGLIHQIEDNGQIQHRIALRLQSQHELKPAVRERISQHFDGLSKGLVSVRWTSRVTTLAAWSGSRRLKDGPASGAEINVAGGESGAVAMLLRKNGHVHLLTAGHVVQNGRREIPPGERLYSPVQDRVPGPHVARFVEGSLFPAYIGGDPYGDETVDYALARIENGYVPTQAHIEEFVGSKIFLPAASAPLEWKPGEGPRVLKGPARTAHCGGRIEALDVDVIVANPLSGTECFARNLIEVSLDENRAIRPGDSGGLITLSTSAGQKPLAMVVAGALNSRLRTSKQNNMTSALYALPLTAIPGIEHWENP